MQPGTLLQNPTQKPAGGLWIVHGGLVFDDEDALLCHEKRVARRFSTGDEEKPVEEAVENRLKAEPVASRLLIEQRIVQSS